MLNMKVKYLKKVSKILEYIYTFYKKLKNYVSFLNRF